MGVLLDRLITVLLRVQHALKMGLLVSGVALGAAALWYVANAPDHSAGEALLARLGDGPVRVSGLAGQGWTGVCLIHEADDPRRVAGTALKACEGWMAASAIYDGYGWLVFPGPACRAIAVHQDFFDPAPRGQARCHPRRGLMSLVLEAGDGNRPVLGLVMD